MPATTIFDTTTLINPPWLLEADNIHATMPTSASFPQFSPQRLRSYILRLPLITRIILIIIVLFCIAGVSHGFQHWAQLIPTEVIAGGMHRINTYPLLHLGLIHTVSNLVALAPLLERFEAEHGSLVTLILFTGRMYKYFPYEGTVFFGFVKLTNTSRDSILDLPSWSLRSHLPLPPPYQYSR